MSWIKSLQSKVKGKAPVREPSYPTTAPPAWEPAPEQVHALGLHSDAPEEEYEAAETFCQQNAPFPSRLLSSEAVDRIRERGCGAWRLELPPGDPARTRSVTLRNGGGAGGKTGVIAVESAAGCRDVCILSDLPLLAGLYDTRGKRGVYFEIKVLRMDVDGVIAVGTACRPYPHWRLPGWNRLSAGLHLDDGRKFFEDPDGGRTYMKATSVKPGDVVGVGYEWARGVLFFTLNGARLPDAFIGVYLPREAHDVYAAIGLAGPGACALEVNFGAGPDFEWKEGNEWKVQAHVGMMPGGSGADDELPSYSDARRDRRIVT